MNKFSFLKSVSLLLPHSARDLVWMIGSFKTNHGIYMMEDEGIYMISCLAKAYIYLSCDLKKINDFKDVTYVFVNDSASREFIS